MFIFSCFILFYIAIIGYNTIQSKVLSQFNLQLNEVMLNLSKTAALKEAQLEEEMKISNQLSVEDDTDICSKNNIAIDANVEEGKVQESGYVPDDYELDI